MPEDLVVLFSFIVGGDQDQRSVDPLITQPVGFQLRAVRRKGSAKTEFRVGWLGFPLQVGLERRPPFGLRRKKLEADHEHGHESNGDPAHAVILRRSDRHGLQ